MHTPRPLIILALLCLLLASPLLGGPAVRPAAEGAACFAETNQCIQGRFLAYWTANGGLARNGFPLTAERQEVLEDGQTYTVQYFERVRLELHPEYRPPFDVLLGQFGRRIVRVGNEFVPALAPATAPAAPSAGAIYFAETEHNLGGRFRAYWEANGDLAQFGFPITEELAQPLPGVGGQYTVQYFERGRFEYHPENAAPYDVLLGQFGRDILYQADLLAGDRGFALLYLTSERVQGQLGSPTTPPVQGQGAYQTFERGVMLYWRGGEAGAIGGGGEAGVITVLCGTPQAGTILANRAGRAISLSFPDTWRPGDDPGGGAGPAPDLSLPRLGFGKLWRENQQARDCLGYATDPDGTGYDGRGQGFSHGGGMLSATTPTGRFIYALFRVGADASYRYERYPDPLP